MGTSLQKQKTNNPPPQITNKRNQIFNKSFNFHGVGQKDLKHSLIRKALVCSSSLQKQYYLSFLYGI